jgi:site-specific DNA-methyltransferase (adenine-specific)
MYISDEIETNLYHKSAKGNIYCLDALEFLKNSESKCADIVFLDPPFNLGKKYGNSDGEEDRLTENEYFNFIENILLESVRVLRDGGAFFLYHLPKWAIRFGSILEEYLQFRHWIAVSMKNGFVRPKYLYPAHYSLLYYSKGKPLNFDRPKIPAQTCQNCGSYVKDYGGYKKYIEDGINLSDIWEDLSPVRHSSKKNRPSNELPIKMLRRIVHISGRENGLIVDPFVGAGTSVVAAVEHNMRFSVSDREKNCCEVTVDRLKNCLNNKNLA